MNAFVTLLRREWMQHQLGWLVALSVPFVLLLLAAIFGEMNFGSEDMPANFPAPMFGALMAINVIATLGLVIVSVLIQAPGLARRDQQDRSIEFWLSLPTPPWHSVAATLLAHLWLLPLVAVGVGIGGGFVLATLGVLREFGLAGLAQLQWGWMLLAALALGLRLALGVVLASLWVSGLLLLSMAACAWLKRWGVPVVVAALAFGHLLVERLFGSDLVGQTLQRWAEGAQRAFLVADHGAASLRQFEGADPTHFGDLLPRVANWLGGDMVGAVAASASPYFLASVLLGAAGFALLVRNRRWGR